MSSDGLHRATVVSTRDPAGQGRIQVLIPALFGTSVTDWVEPHAPTTTLPDPGSTVFVMFLGGDTSKAVYLARAAAATGPANDEDLAVVVAMGGF